MTYRLFTFVFLLTAFSSFSQSDPDFGEVESHLHFVKQLSNAKDENFEQILSAYDAHIEVNPYDIIAQIERCKFIGNSYFDEYEGYNLKYEETEACINALNEKYPEHPAVLIYVAENRYGEERLTILETARELMDENPEKWSNDQKAEVYKLLGDSYQEEQFKSLSFYKKAQRLGDSLDLSLQIAEIYESQGKEDLAKETLLRSLEKDTFLWNINQKAHLLLKLNEPEKALELFDIVNKKDSTYINNNEMAQAMAELGNLDAARDFLVRDTLSEWNRIGAKQRLFSHDIAHSDSKLALQTYRSLQNETTYDDFFGIKRFQVFIKDPFLTWNPKEVFHFSLLYLLVILAFIIPYMWVLPVFGVGKVLKKSGFKIRPRLSFSWTLEHFWLLSFVYLLAQLATLFVFEYEQTMNYLFDLVSVYTEDLMDKDLLANEMILFVLLMAIGTLSMLNRERLKVVFSSNLRIRQMIGLGVLFVIFNRIIMKVLGLFVDIEEPSFDFNLILSAEQEILAMMSVHGFLMAALLVVVIVPIYEEIIFRGVILNSVEKYIGFKGANIFQAILFGLVHDNIALFVFFFVFALVIGYWVKRSKGLLTGIIFHGVHNLTVLLALYYLSKIGGGF